MAQIIDKNRDFLLIIHDIDRIFRGLGWKESIFYVDEAIFGGDVRIIEWNTAHHAINGSIFWQSNGLSAILWFDRWFDR